MSFLSYWVSLVSPRSQLAAVLATRSADLNQVNNPFELDRSPLRNQFAEPISYPEIADTGYSTFFSTRSTIVDGDAGGVLAKWTENGLLFLGFRKEIVPLVAEQDFAAILNYKFEPGQRKVSVNCVLGVGRFKSMKLQDRVKSRSSNNYAYFTLTGLVQFTTSGLAFGVLPLTQ
jgi:hypothetical protein